MTILERYFRRPLTRRAVLRCPVPVILTAALSRCALRGAEKLYIVGSTATGIQFSFISLETNTLTGAMIDMMNAVAQVAGMRIELRTTPFAARRVVNHGGCLQALLERLGNHLDSQQRRRSHAHPGNTREADSRSA